MKKKFIFAIPLLFIAFMLYIYISVIQPAPTKEISIATGRNTGVYYQYAQNYKKLLEEEGISVSIIQTAGSIETLQLLNEKRVDIGFVQGGTASEKEIKTLKSICSLYFEPLWIFHRTSLGEVHYLNALKNSRLSIGEKGSGTIALAQLLIDNSMLNQEDTTIYHLNTKEAYEAFTKNELDAFFTVLSPKSKLIQEIMKNPSLSLIHLNRISAFSQKFSFLHAYAIHEGSISLKDNIPKHNINLLATTASLVTHSGVDDSLIRLITIKIKESMPRDSLFPSRENLEIPIHEASNNYLLKGDNFLEKFLPYWVASNIDRLKFLLIPLLTLILPLMKGFMPLYTWRSRSKIYKWYKKIDSISENWEGYDEVKLQSTLDELENLIIEIKSKTHVPLSFKGEYYTLQLHIDNIIHRMREKLAL